MPPVPLSQKRFRRRDRLPAETVNDLLDASAANSARGLGVQRSSTGTVIGKVRARQYASRDVIANFHVTCVGKDCTIRKGKMRIAGMAPTGGHVLADQTAVELSGTDPWVFVYVARSAPDGNGLQADVSTTEPVSTDDEYRIPLVRYLGTDPYVLDEICQVGDIHFDTVQF